MKKLPVIGVSVAVLVVSVIIGIASIPDEALTNSSLDNSQAITENIQLPPATAQESQNLVPNSMPQTTDNSAEIDGLKQEIKDLKSQLVDLKTNSQVPSEIQTAPQSDKTTAEKNQTESHGHVIKVTILDGIGAHQR